MTLQSFGPSSPLMMCTEPHVVLGPRGDLVLSVRCDFIERFARVEVETIVQGRIAIPLLPTGMTSPVPQLPRRLPTRLAQRG